MNVIKHEIRYHFKSWLIWTLSLGLFVVIFSTEFSAYYNNPDLLGILDAFPEDLLQAFGIAGTNLTTIDGFMSLVMIYMNLIGSVFGLILGATLLSKEHKARTAELLLVMPAKRSRLLLDKIVAAIVMNFLLVAVVFAMMIVSVLQYEPNQDFFLFMGLCALVMMVLLCFWSGVGMLLASVLSRPKQAGMIGTILVFVTYVLSIFIPLVDSLDFLKILTPFAYFDTRKILSTLTLSWVEFIGLLGLTCVFFGLSLFFYRKKDIVY
jgi:ABC-2 type transport system permease protein